MIHTADHRAAPALAVLVACLALVSPSLATAERPVKELLESHIGWDVNKTKTQAGAPQAERNLCTVASGNECQPGSQNSGAGGFTYPVGVATGPAPQDYVYVADRSNHRIQAFTPLGAFVSMFGWDVNRSKTEANAPQAERDICTAVSGDVCQAGVDGVATGQFHEPWSVTVDQGGSLYVAEKVITGGAEGERVQKLNATGEWVWEVGREVNKTTKANLCTAEEANSAGVTCGASALHAANASEPVEPGAFEFAEESGNILAVGGGEALLYVATAGGVQEFEASGEYKREIAVGAVADAVALDPAAELYVLEGSKATTHDGSVIRKFTAAGVEVKDGHWPFAPVARELTERALGMSGLAVDPDGRVAVTGDERYGGPPPNYGEKTRTFGLLLDGASAQTITEFEMSSGGIAFGDTEVAGSGGFDMYLDSETSLQEVSAATGQQILGYRPVPVAEVKLEPASCAPGVERETDVTFDCRLSGEVNPWGVPDTEALFEWGVTPALGSATPKGVVCASVCGSAPVSVSVSLDGLAPNEKALYDRLAAYDREVVPPEGALHSAELSFSTPSVPAKMIGAPEVAFVHATSAVLTGELNPENTSTVYAFAYGVCDSGLQGCADVALTSPLVSGSYGSVGVMLEATGLQPGTTYRYALVAVNEHEQASAGEEGVFATLPAPVPHAVTGGYSALGSTSAVISGTVDPDGEPASYTFQLGVYEGAATRYGIVFSGPAGSGAGPVPESLTLTGLQPGTTYAYRVTVKSGYGESVGAPGTFTTVGLPAILASPPALPLLGVPNVAFPKTASVSVRKAKKGGHRRVSKRKAKRRNRRAGSSHGADRHRKQHK